MSEQEKSVGKVIAKALKEESFKKRLIADPAGTLKGEGVEIPQGITLKVVADTDSLRHIVLPASGEITDEMLENIAAGNSWGPANSWGKLANSWGKR